MKVEQKAFRVVKKYRTPYPDSIFFHEGERIEIGGEFSDDPDWKDWFWCKGQNDNQAWTPKQFVRVEDGFAVLIRDYDARELSVEVGEELVIGEVVNGFGTAEKPNGEKGWVPMKCLTPN